MDCHIWLNYDFLVNPYDISQWASNVWVWPGRPSTVDLFLPPKRCQASDGVKKWCQVPSLGPTMSRAMMDDHMRMMRWSTSRANELIYFIQITTIITFSKFELFKILTTPAKTTPNCNQLLSKRKPSKLLKSYVNLQPICIK